MKKQFDVVVIGGGPGGTPAAIELAAKGKKVLLVEKSGRLGGACLFVGCIPSKIIKHSADEYSYSKQTCPSSKWPDESRDSYWTRTRSTMERILSTRSGAALEAIAKFNNLSFVSGSARFLANREVEITKGDGSRFTADFTYAIIATGASSFIPPFKGNAVNNVLTSETIFGRDALPETMVIIGGGPIGIELAQMYSKLDVKCTVIEVMDTILHGIVEPEFARALTSKLMDSHVDIHTSSQVLEINTFNQKLGTTFRGRDGSQRTVESDVVLVSAGKVPNTKSLNLESTDITFTPKGITVDEHLETNVKGVYATGDVIQAPKFAHTATYEAHIVAANILAGNSVKADFSKNSWVLFSDPEIASVGYTEAEAMSRGVDVVTGVYNYKTDAVAQINGNPFGFLKFVVERKTSTIIGIHIFVNDAASIAGEAALIVSKGLTLRDVSQAIYPHPTLSEAYGFLSLKMLSEG